MSKIYESLKDVGSVTSNHFALTLNDKMEELEKFITNLHREATQLYPVIQQAKKDGASEAKRVELLTETFKAKIAALEAQLEKTEESLRGNDSTIKALEENFAGKLQDLESQLKGKEILLTEREKQINELTSQMQALTKRIKDMSAFFRQAEALAVLETQGIGTVLEVSESKNAQDNTATSQIDSPKLISNKDDSVHKTVSTEFFDRMTNELTQVIGPMASVIIRDHVKAIGESMEKFPQMRVTELLKIVSEEIPDQNRKTSFQELLTQSPAVQ